MGKDIIKVIVGQRRVGKSYFLSQIQDELLARTPSLHTISINKELYEFDQIKDYHDLISFVQRHEKNSASIALFIDEIQEIADFEKALRHFQAKGHYDIYISGSNAHLLSGELATFLGGRYVEIQMYSLSFPEFLQFHKLSATKETLQQYITFGGLPYLINLDLKESVVYDYLKSIHSSILLKDIVARHQIRNVSFLENLVKYLANNVGNLISAKKISDYLKSQRLSISPSIVLNYLEYLRAAFFTHNVKRLDIVGKKLFEIGEKIYFQDIGLKHAIVPYRPAMIGQVLENLVHNHLKYLDYTVHIGHLYDKEIDFIATRAEEKIYIQVAYLLADDATVQREFGSLLAIKDNYRKIVVSFDEWSSGTYEGVEHYSILDFLTSESFIPNRVSQR
ncbi:ATP-binding protein [candidate division KSB1 bacterium]|nr:ATP-binding protein [candidate division KSB1 bacterium]